MKRPLRTAVLALCLLLWSTVAAQEEEAPPIEWQKDLDCALKESYLTGKPLILHFCPGGRIALNEDMSTLQDNRVKKAAPYCVWVRLDPEEFRALADECGVKEIPSLLVVDHNKKKLNAKNVEGHAFPEDVLNLMKEVLSSVKIPAPEDLQKVAKSFKKAQTLVSKKKLKKAIPVLKKLARFKPEIGYVKEAKKALAAIEEHGRQQIEAARKLLEEGKKEEADKLLRWVESELRGLDIAKKAKKTRLEMYRTGKDMEKLKEKSQEEQAREMLRLAQLYEDNGLLEKAIEQCEKILKEYPKTETAALAAKKIKELKALIAKKKEKQGETEE